MLADPVSRFRRFARAVTLEVGALDTSFLGRGRPLGAARVLNAIGVGRTDVAEIREHLQLDSGLMSRLLRGPRGRGPRPHHAASRRRPPPRRHPHPAGRREFQAYDELSNARASALLDRAPRSDELLAAMDLIACALGRDRIAIEEADPRGEAARHCLGEYYAELQRRFEKGFDAVALARSRRRRHGAAARGVSAGAIGRGGDRLRRPQGRRRQNRGNQAAVDMPDGARLRPRQAPDGRRRDCRARTVGIETLRLDTNSALPEALKLYRTSGWVEIARFNDDPYPDHFFEKRL